jgi:hypothetical protein
MFLKIGNSDGKYFGNRNPHLKRNDWISSTHLIVRIQMACVPVVKNSQEGTAFYNSRPTKRCSRQAAREGRLNPEGYARAACG